MTTANELEASSTRLAAALAIATVATVATVVAALSVAREALSAAAIVAVRVLESGFAYRLVVGDLRFATWRPE